MLRIYFDEDAMDYVLVDGLRAVGCDVASANTDDMCGRADDEQLAHAMASGRVLFSYNIRDYSRITSQWVRDGRSHAGVIVVQKERYGVGEQLRRLRNVVTSASAEDLASNVTYLNDWG